MPETVVADLDSDRPDRAGCGPGGARDACASPAGEVDRQRSNAPDGAAAPHSADQIPCRADAADDPPRLMAYRRWRRRAGSTQC